MTRLDCNVTSCLHNSESCCCKSEIMVDGSQARNSADTCCGSYDENRGGAFTNLFKTPEKQLSVGCEAVNCAYNQEYRCKAEHIAIAGDGASEAAQTKCSSFKMR